MAFYETIFYFFKFQISVGQGWGRDGSAGGTARRAPAPVNWKIEMFEKVFSCPHGPTENIFEWFLAVRMALPKTFLNGFSGYTSLGILLTGGELRNSGLRSGRSTADRSLTAY